LPRGTWQKSISSSRAIRSMSVLYREAYSDITRVCHVLVHRTACHTPARVSHSHVAPNIYQKKNRITFYGIRLSTTMHVNIVLGSIHKVRMDGGRASAKAYGSVRGRGRGLAPKRTPSGMAGCESRKCRPLVLSFHPCLLMNVKLLLAASLPFLAHSSLHRPRTGSVYAGGDGRKYGKRTREGKIPDIRPYVLYGCSLT